MEPTWPPCLSMPSSPAPTGRYLSEKFKRIGCYPVLVKVHWLCDVLEESLFVEAIYSRLYSSPREVGMVLGCEKWVVRDLTSHI